MNYSIPKKPRNNPISKPPENKPSPSISSLKNPKVSSFDSFPSIPKAKRPRKESDKSFSKSTSSNNKVRTKNIPKPIETYNKTSNLKDIDAIDCDTTNGKSIDNNLLIYTTNWISTHHKLYEKYLPKESVVPLRCQYIDEYYMTTSIERNIINSPNPSILDSNRVADQLSTVTIDGMLIEESALPF